MYYVSKILGVYFKENFIIFKFRSCLDGIGVIIKKVLCNIVFVY